MHIGVYWEDIDEDVRAIHDITRVCLEDWNVRFTGQESVLLFCNPESPKIACVVASSVLACFAPDGPDAYKRVAALLVTMSMCPFVVGRHECDQQNPESKYRLVEALQGERLRDFGITFLVDSLSAYFDPFEQQRSDGQWIRMNQFPGFTAELRNELIRLLYSYSESFRMGLTGGIDIPALAQATLSISLILKSVYPIEDT